MRLFLTITLLALVAGTAASAEPGASPIVLNDCQFAASPPSARRGDPNVTRTRALWVDFRNTGNTTITALTFDAVKGGEHLVVTDKGRFTKGATVTHQLLGLATEWTGADWDLDSCKVSVAQFADGSTREY